jgi:ABC-type uncharacterized transport system permease subunit
MKNFSLKFLSKKIHTIGALASLGLFALPAFAQTSGLVNPLNASSLTDLLQEILNYVVQIGSIFLTLALIYIGFLFVQARGNPEKVGKARNALLWTVIGGLLLLGASALATVITSTISNL